MLFKRSCIHKILVTVILSCMFFSTVSLANDVSEDLRESVDTLTAIDNSLQNQYYYNVARTFSDSPHIGIAKVNIHEGQLVSFSVFYSPKTGDLLSQNIDNFISAADVTTVLNSVDKKVERDYTYSVSLSEPVSDLGYQRGAVIIKIKFLN